MDPGVALLSVSRSTGHGGSLRWLLGLVLTATVGLAACSADTEEAAESNQAESNQYVSGEQLGELTTTTEPVATTTSAAPASTQSTVPEPTTMADAFVDSAFIDPAFIDPASIEPVAYSADVHPILERSCASCHGPEQAGASGIVLAAAGDAAEFATGIQLYTGARLMPPWPASSRSLPFHDDPSLSPVEIATIARWVDDGAELDVEPSTPIEPVRAPSFLEDPEIVMTSAAGPYAGDPETSDDYRCLVFDPGNDEREWIIGTHFVPDQEEVVHHGIVKLASAGLRQRAQDIDDRSPAPGWSCYGGTGLEGRGGSLLDMGGWAPGTQPERLPEGYAVPLEPGDFFVVQIHYHYTDAAPADLSEYHLDIASNEEVLAAGGSFDTLNQALYLGPAEIPCYEGDSEPLCDRNAARERVQALYGPMVGAFADFFMLNCGARVEDFADMTDGDAWSTCDLPVTNPGRITSVFGHMHELGSSIRLTLNPDTADEQILLDIPDWDFEWQLNYRPVEDIVIDRGDTIRVECAWNRERAPYEAVGYILWSDGTGDEMCYSSVTTAPLR